MESTAVVASATSGQPSSSNPMEGLPFEIWDAVASLLTDEELAALIGVNSFFFNLGMIARYNEVTVDTGDKNGRKCLLKILEQQVARRVRKLTLQLQHPVVGPTRMPAPEPSVRKQIMGQLRTAMGKVVPNRSQLLQVGQDARLCSIEGIIEILIDALPGMTNVVDLRIVTWTLPSSTNLQPFYATAWNVFGSKLRRVSICANMGGHKSLIESSPGFVNLDNLELEFSDNVTTPQLNNDTADIAILTDVVVPFVNKFCPQIKIFKIRSWAKLDLSYFFLRIDTFPQIEDALVRIPFNHALRADPSGFTQFLHDSSRTLKKVALRLTPMGLALDPLREQSLCEWMLQTVSDPNCFINAKELDVCPTHLPAGINVLHLCIQHSKAQLTTFKVRDRYLSSHDVISIVKELRLATSLTTLRLNVSTLSVDMFDAMAENLPALRFLWLSVGEHSHSSLTDSMGLFQEEMKTRRYENWKLWDLTIWQGGIEPDSQTMLALAYSIPSVRSFWGTAGRTNRS